MSFTPLSFPQECTTIHVLNIHCDSCVSTMRQCISNLSSLLSVEISSTKETVTVKHPKQFSAALIQRTLLDTGFDVVPRGPSGDHPTLHPRLNEHLKYCLHCRNKETTDRLTERQTCSITLSISGMTCSSCAVAITETVLRIPGVSDIAVNLLSGFAKVAVESNDVAGRILTAVEDCGFEARIIVIESLRSKEDAGHPARTVSLRIDGMISKNCTAKIMAAIEQFGDGLTVVKPLISLADPVLTVCYLPCFNTLSIRTIMTTIAATSHPPYQISIESPPSVEKLVHAMQLRERRQIFFRLIFAFVAAVPTFLIAVVYMSLVKDGNPSKAYLLEPLWAGSVARAEWALLFISTPVMFYSASGYHRRCLKEIYTLWRPGSSTPYLERFTRFGSMNLLVSLGVSVSYFSSISLLCLEAKTPPHTTGTITTYFDTTVFLTMFLLTGRYIEAYCKARTADAVSGLGSLRPAYAFLLVPEANGESSPTIASPLEDVEKGALEGDLSVPLHSKVEKVPVDHLEVGDIVRVASGSRPPADGTVTSGQQGVFDESSLTGESKPVTKNSGDKVFAGTINKGQPLDMRIDAIGGNTMLDEIIKIMRDGQTRRAPIERVADQIIRYFVPVITALSLVTWIIWLALGLSGSLPSRYLDISIGGWPVWSLQFAIAVFVIACPCGVGLAAPTALLVGLGLAAKFGILARGGGEAFQELSQLDLVVFDKTGTLTEGEQPRVSDCVILPSVTWSRSMVLGIAAELESVSLHPLAIAIRHFAGNSDVHSGTAFEEVPGKGLKACFKSLNYTAIIGNEVWIQEHGAQISEDLSQRLLGWKEEAKSVVLLAIQTREDVAFEIAAIFAIQDPLRPGSSEVISQLSSLGISTWMISGDNFTTASAVARVVGIPANHVIAGVLPHQKSLHIEQLQRSGISRSLQSSRARRPRQKPRTIVAMVGDGINDAPALAVADVGIALGSGSDIALSSASFVILSSDLRSLVTLHDLSICVINRIKFNLGWALVYNMIALPIAAGVIYPTGHRLDPVWASLAMALSSVSVVCSSLLLKRYKAPAHSTQEHIRNGNSED